MSYGTFPSILLSFKLSGFLTELSNQFAVTYHLIPLGRRKKNIKKNSAPDKEG